MTSEHPIDVQTSERDASLVVTVKGELDMSSVPDLAASLDDVHWARYERVIFELLGISFIDSSGLGALITMRNEHPETEIVLVTEHGGLVGKVLELTSMKDLFPIYASTEAALA